MYTTYAMAPDLLVTNHHVNVRESAQQLHALRLLREGKKTSTPKRAARRKPFSTLRERHAKKAAKRRFAKSFQILFW